MANTDTTAILKELYPKVAKSLDKNRVKYKNLVGKFINVRHTELYDNAPYTRIYFTPDDYKRYWECLQLSEKEVATCLSHTYYANLAKFNPPYAKDPLTMTQLCVIRYFLLKKDDKDVEISMIYLAFSGKMYPSIHYGSFPTAQPQQYRHIMEYVINNELSQKYDLKKNGTLVGTMLSIMRTWLDTYSKDGLFKRYTDEDCVYLIQQFRDRLKSFIINIAQVYYEVYDNKDKYLSYSSDKYDEEDFRLADNDSLKAAKYTESAMNYITTKGVNYKFCQMAADSNVKTDEVKSIIESIQMEPKNIPLIKEFIGLTISEFMANSKTKDITNVEYLSSTIATKPNSKNKNVLRQKEIIEYFLDENSPQYRKRKNRPATYNSYVRCVTAYYCLVTSQANK